MNDFTKEELEILHNCIRCTISEYNDDKEKSLEKFAEKIQSMIDNYPVVNVKSIAKFHLNEACSLISHAMCLLGIENE